MRANTRIGRLVAAVVLAAGSLVAVSAPPAYAYGKACSAERGGVQVCVYVEAGGVRGVVRSVNSSPSLIFLEVTVAAVMCNGNGTVCYSPPVAQRSDSWQLWSYQKPFETSMAPYSLGHRYKAVASWTMNSSGARFVNVWTPPQA